MTHEEASDLLAVFALDAVDAAEYEQIEEHLSDCPRCRAELDAHSEVAAALGNSVEPLPEGLWSSISGRLSPPPDEVPPPLPRLLTGGIGGAEVDGRTFQRPGSSESTRSSRSSWLSRSSRGRMATVVSIAAAAVVVAAVLGVNLIRADHQVTQLKSAVGTSARTAVAAALATSGRKVVNLESAEHRRLAQFVMVPNGQGYLVKSTLPRLRSTATYQLWGVVGGKSISLGLLGTSPDQATFTWAEARRPTALGITVEPAGGSVLPSGLMVATGTV